MSRHLPRLGNPNLLPAPGRPRVGFGMFAFRSPCPYACAAAAACCPVPAASDDAVLIPELPSPGMPMTRHSRCNRNHGHRRSADAHQAPCCGRGPGVTFCLHAVAACGLQPTSVSALSSRARMSGVTDPGHRRRPGPRQARTAPAARTLLGFNREMPGFHPRTVRVFIQGAPNKNPHSPGN